MKRDLTSVVRAMVDAVPDGDTRRVAEAHRHAANFHMALETAMYRKFNGHVDTAMDAMRSAAESLQHIPIKWLAGMGVDITDSNAT